MKRALLILLLLSGTAAAADVFPQEINADTVLVLMNEYRAASGLLPLRLDARLTRAAEGRMQDMVDGGWWAHRAPDGTSPFVWLAIADYRHSTAAENLARGFDTARILVETWMESPGHRANILGPRYSDCGIAVIDGSTSGPARGRSVVVMFGGRRAGTVAAR